MNERAALFEPIVSAMFEGKNGAMFWRIFV